MREQPDEAAAQRSEERLNAPVGEASEETQDGIGGREACDTQHSMKRRVKT